MGRVRQLDLNAGLGWADYADDEYTEGSPFAVTASSDTEIPNNGQAGV